MELIFFSMAGACILYFMLIAAYSGISTSYIGIWLCLAAVFILMGFFGRKRERKREGMPRMLPVFIYTTFFMSMFIFALTMYLVTADARRKPVERADYVVVIGERIFEDGISNSLRLRLDRAYEYYTQNPDTVFILSGGQKEGDPVPEALAMYNYLFLKGVPEKNMLMEMSSTNTRENIYFSHRVIERDLKRHGREWNEDISTAILTSDFNMYRSLRYAGRAGYIDPGGIGTRTDMVMFPHECVRESCAIVAGYLMGEL